MSGLRAARQILGDEHETTLSLMTNLSSLLQLTQKFDEALPLCEEVLKLRREVLLTWDAMMMMLIACR